MTTRRRPARTSQASPSKPEGGLKRLFKKFTSAKQIKDFKHILNSLLYLLMVLLVGVIIQYVWNSAMSLLDIEGYHMTIFEAAILWVCIY